MTFDEKINHSTVKKRNYTVNYQLFVNFSLTQMNLQIYQTSILCLFKVSWVMVTIVELTCLIKKYLTLCQNCLRVSFENSQWWKGVEMHKLIFQMNWSWTQLSILMVWNYSYELNLIIATLSGEMAMKKDLTFIQQ